jgi:hypothetical protein
VNLRTQILYRISEGGNNTKLKFFLDVISRDIEEGSAFKLLLIYLKNDESRVLVHPRERIVTSRLESVVFRATHQLTSRLSR